MAGSHVAKTKSPKNGRGKNTGLVLLILFLMLLLLAAAVFIILRLNLSEAADPLNGVRSEQKANTGLVVPERPEMIDITAYESLELKADTLEQSVRFDNPLQNNCWLVITLSLEDGTVLWKSQELQPGQVVRSITLNQSLAAGEYENAVLRYQHWTYDAEKEPLNGAETIVTLKVVP